MHGNGDRDPLDGWLSQQVAPLSPPPGTFELITRRARRRKVRKVAVTVASAAVVAAGVAVAVPGGLLVHLSPSPVNAASVADGKTPTASGGTQHVTGSGTPLPTTTPALTPSSSAGSQPQEPNGPVPGNFQPASVTFVSTSHAWAIGQAGTPGRCADANPYICTSIVSTTDGGRTWEGGPAPKTGAPSGATGVSGIRFLDGVNGWAFGPELWATHDSGSTWQQIDTHGQRVTDLETAGNRAYALWASCTGTNTSSFAYYCHSFTLMTTAAGSDNWQPAGGPTSGLTDGGNPTSAVLALTSTVGYLLAPDGTLYSGPLGGAWQRVGTAPCQPGTPQADGLPSRALLALVNSANPAIECPGISVTSPPEISTSANGGAFWTLSGASWSGLSSRGVATSLAAAPDGTLVLATTTGLYVLPPGAAQWTPAAMGGAGAPAGGFTYVGMTTDEQGVALPASTSLHEIWMTTDGGGSWAPATPITPGS